MEHRWTYASERSVTYDGPTGSSWIVRRDGEVIGHVQYSTAGGDASYNWRVPRSGQFGYSRASLAEALNQLRNSVEGSLL